MNIFKRFFNSKHLNFIRLLLANEIPFRYLFSKKVRFPHPVGIVISNEAQIGKNVLIFSNVLIGGMKYGNNQGFPIIEDDVVIYSGAVIFGGIKIGRGSIIGANATVKKDIPPMSVVYNSMPLVVKSQP